MKVTNLGQVFGLVWGGFGIISFLGVVYSTPPSSDTAIGVAFFLNSILFIIPCLLLYYGCKGK